MEASDGLEAWLLLQHQGVHVDLVLADVIMPYVTGTELAARIRHDFPHLPVILLSAYNSTDLVARGLAPSGELVTKPFDLQDLVRRIEDVLGRDRPNPPAA
jgi:CheY-like chemotaxis protein